jgi:predicted transcriptional regulator
VARLGQLERKVMDVLWESMGTEKTVRQVAEELPNHAYTTILTVLDRLQRKHMVRRTKDGRAHRYTAAASREAYTAELMLAEVVTSSEATVLRQALDGVADEPTVAPENARKTRPDPKGPR